MSTEAKRRSSRRARWTLVVPLVGICVVVLAVLLPNLADSRSYALVAQGSAGGRQWALIAERPRWIGGPCLNVRSEGAALDVACENTLDRGEPRVAFMTGAQSWVVYGVVSSGVRTVELEFREAGGPVRTVRLSTSSVEGFDARIYVGVVAANPDTGGSSALTKATLTREI